MFLLVGAARTLGIAAHRDTFGVTQELVQPGTALRQRLLMRVNAFYLVQLAGTGQQVLTYAQLDFAADTQR